MKKHIQIIVNKQNLTTQQAKEVIIGISQGLFTPSEIVCFISLFMMRPITINELTGFREALLELCIRLDLSEYEALDMCGTGGDGKNTFNISTLASFVVASCNIPVVKHGNYGLSSISGSSNVLEKIGITFSANESVIKNCLDHAGITILHAPLFHPAMKTVGQIRKDLGVKTFFNILGPLINPSNPAYQVVGVYNLEVARMFTYLFQQTPTNFSIVHSIDGYDEVSLTTKAKIITRDSEFVIDPTDFKGIKKIEPNKIYGGNTKEEAAALFMNIISGNGSEEQNNVVAINAAIAIKMVKKCSLSDAFELAKEKLQNLEALNRLKKLQQICQ